MKAGTRLHEGGITSNRGSECHGEFVPGPCTHRPSHAGSVLGWKCDITQSKLFFEFGQSYERQMHNWDEVVTR